MLCLVSPAWLMWGYSCSLGTFPVVGVLYLPAGLWNQSAVHIELQSGNTACHLVCERTVCYVAGGLIVVVFRMSEAHPFFLSSHLFPFSKSGRKSLLSCEQKSHNWLGKDGVRQVMLGHVWEDLGDRWHPCSCWWLKTDLWPSEAGNVPGKLGLCISCAVVY